MKIRKQVRALHKLLYQEVYNALSKNHQCAVFIDDAGDCVVCQLLHMKKIFAVLHLVREHKLFLDWFDAEKQLYELLGEKAFLNKIEIELKEVSNFPRKQCNNCGHIVTFYCSFRIMARSRNRDFITKCGYCGYTVEFSEIPQLPISKEKIKQEEDRPPTLRMNPRSPRRRMASIKSLSLEELGISLIDKQTNIPSSPPPIPHLPPILPTNLAVPEDFNISAGSILNNNNFVQWTNVVELTSEDNTPIP